jgi:hypothetical protein
METFSLEGTGVVGRRPVYVFPARSVGIKESHSHCQVQSFVPESTIVVLF